MNRPRLALIVPAFNEAHRLKETLPATREYLRIHRPESELIVDDDGSTDGTAQVAEEIFARNSASAARVLRTAKNYGKGHAVRAGLLATEATLAAFTDADLSTPISQPAGSVSSGAAAIQRGRR